MGGYSLAYSFPDESASFVHGFEAGRISMCMQQGLTPIEDGLPVHEENADVIRRIGRHYNYQVELMPTDTEGWMYLKARKVLPGVNEAQSN